MHFHCGDPVIGNFSLSEHAGIFKVSIFKRRKAVKVFSLAKLGAPPPPVSLHHHPHTGRGHGLPHRAGNLPGEPLLDLGYHGEEDII